MTTNSHFGKSALTTNGENMTDIVTTTREEFPPAPQPPAQPPIPPQAPRERFLGAEEIFRGAGTLDADRATMAILMAPIDESQICIRPDGIVYLPWVFYADRLRKAFGVAWSLVAGDKPTLEGTQVIWLHHLIIQGCYVSSAYGQCNYHPNNRGMSYGDAIEGSKSDALTRCCKPLGISAELWDPAFILAWKKKWAEPGGGGGYGGSKWRKRKAEDVGWDQAFLNRMEDLNTEYFKKIEGPEKVDPPDDTPPTTSTGAIELTGEQAIACSEELPSWAGKDLDPDVPMSAYKDSQDLHKSWIKGQVKEDFKGWATVCRKRDHEEHSNATYSDASNCVTCRGILRWVLTIEDLEPDSLARTRAQKIIDFVTDERKEVQEIKQQMKKAMSAHGIKRNQWKEAIEIASGGRASSFPDITKWTLQDAEGLLLIFTKSGEDLVKELGNGDQPDAA